MGLFKKKKPQYMPPPPFNQYDYQDKLVPYLKKVYMEQASASYVGGSLCINLNSIKGIVFSNYIRDEVIFISTSDEKWNEEVRFFAGLCYIKYKGGNQEMVDESIKNCFYIN
ncbi:MAG: hypothetical protein KBC30_11600 [Planctomycetes bacterium]|nr:hypothetical protein [Planctomycetota bacterium]